MNITYRVYIYILCAHKKERNKNETLLDQQNTCVQLCA